MNKRRPTSDEILQEIYRLQDQCFTRDEQKATAAVKALLMYIETEKTVQRFSTGNPGSELATVTALNRPS